MAPRFYIVNSAPASRARESHALLHAGGYSVRRCRFARTFVVCVANGRATSVTHASVRYRPPSVSICVDALRNAVAREREMGVCSDGDGR